MKKWYQSKEIWFNVILTIINATAVLDGMISPQLGAAIQGIGTVVLRVWFTSSQIEKSIR